jgi:CheY-like chemotaxis protein
MTDIKTDSPEEKQGAQILLVEDREEDVFFFQRALKKAGLNHHITHVRDGEEAIKYLARQAPYDDATKCPSPDVVVLDLKMPKASGFEVLKWLKDQKSLKPAPVVVLTSSDRENDRAQARDLGALSYYIKPVDFTKLVGVAKDINRRWIEGRREHGLLIVDDNPDDRFLIERAFQKLNVGYRVSTAESGSDGLAYLKGEGKYADRKAHPFPSFILTDLKMPHGDGFEILSFLQKHPEILVVPVVMLSGSDDPDDVRRAYLLGASSYIVKPYGMDALEGIVQKLHYYWSECAVPMIDDSGRALATNSVGKLGERFPGTKKPE